MKRRRSIPPDEVPQLLERAKAILMEGVSSGDPDQLAKFCDVAVMFDKVKRELQSPCPSIARVRDLVEQTVIGIALDDEAPLDADGGRIQ